MVTLTVLPLLGIKDRGPLGFNGGPAWPTLRALGQQKTLSQNQEVAKKKKSRSGWGLKNNTKGCHLVI